MGMEEWKPIKDFEDKYAVSNLGRVKNIRTNKIKKPHILPSGYIMTHLYIGDGIYKNCLIHRLVAEAFIEKPLFKEYLEVDHIDCNPANNKVDNLQWVTRKENLDRSFDLKHQTKNKKPVQQFNLDGQLITTYESVCEAFRQTNIRHISEAASGIRKTAGGYKWKYI